MRISDWSSDVCSSDLQHFLVAGVGGDAPFDACHDSISVAWAGLFVQEVADDLPGLARREDHRAARLALHLLGPLAQILEIGRASCRERVCQSVYIAVVAGFFKKKKTKKKRQHN